MHAGLRASPVVLLECGADGALAIIEEEETVAGVACVAISLAFLGEPLAAVSVSVPVHRLSSRQRSEMIATMLQTREARAPSA